MLSSNQSWAKIIFKNLPNHDKNDKLEEKMAQASQLHQPPREPTLWEPTPPTTHSGQVDEATVRWL